MIQDLKKRQLAVEMEDDVVRIEIRCVDIYEAIELYEKLCVSARKGKIEFDLMTAPRD